MCHSGRRQDIREIEVLTVLNMTNTFAAANKIVCDIEMGTFSGTTTQELIVDTGSSVSLLPEHVYKQYFSEVLSHIQKMTFQCWDVLRCLRDMAFSTCHILYCEKWKCTYGHGLNTFLELVHNRK